MFTVLGASGWLMIFFRLLYLVLRILPIIATFGVLSQKISSYWGRSFNISLLERFSHCIRWICSSRALSHALHCRDFLPVLKLRGGAGVPADRLLHLLPQLQWRDRGEDILVTSICRWDNVTGASVWGASKQHQNQKFETKSKLLSHCNTATVRVCPLPQPMYEMRLVPVDNTVYLTGEAMIFMSIDIFFSRWQRWRNS